MDLLLIQNDPVNQDVVDGVKASIAGTAVLDTNSDDVVAQADVDAAKAGLNFLLENLDYDQTDDLNKGKVYLGVVTATDDEIQLDWADL